MNIFLISLLAALVNAETIVYAEVHPTKQSDSNKNIVMKMNVIKKAINKKDGKLNEKAAATNVPTKTTTGKDEETRKMIPVPVEMMKAMMPFSNYLLNRYVKIKKPEVEKNKASWEWGGPEDNRAFCQSLCLDCKCFGVYCHECSLLHSSCPNCCEFFPEWWM